MYQFIILGLLFLFIVLHFYTDIKNYINTGNIIEGNDEDATVPNAGADAGADAGAGAGAGDACPCDNCVDFNIDSLLETAALL